MTAQALSWAALPRAAQVYVALVMAAGFSVLVTFFPLTYPRPALLAMLLVAGCLTSIWKVNLPIPLVSGSTLSMSYAADLLSLLALGPRHAVVIAAAGAWAQCTFNVKRPYPRYRTVFSVAAEVIAMAVTGVSYGWLGGSIGPVEFSGLAKPLVGAIAAYFFVNTGLVAAAIALSTGRRFPAVWREDFLWSGASFVVTGSAGAAAAIVIDRGQHWEALLMLAPMYLTYRTYGIFVDRLEDQRRHAAETRRLHDETVAALSQARDAERALEGEKARLAAALAAMTRLEAARNQLLEREHEARKAAEEANRSKDQFLAMVSHELRTPLNAILGWSDMLCSGTLATSRRDRALHAIHDSAKRQAQLIEELLDVARIMSGKLRLERVALDFNEIVRAAVEVVQPGADAKRIRIGVDGDPRPCPYVGDAVRLQQIVWNLLTNAIKFTPDGGAVHIRLRRDDRIVELRVADTGSGIPSDFLPAVFEPFRQADGSTTRRQGGLGLGLSIVKHLVEAHGGGIAVDSGGEGAGSTFTVRLPMAAVYAVAADPAAPACSVHTIGAPDPTASLAGLSVLVVDDDEASREVVAAYLERSEAMVLSAATAAEAFELLQREHVDVLLADIAMPDEDGYSLIRRVRALSRAQTASIPAVALTALARAEDRQRAVQAGFQLHLPKPIDARALVAAVASVRKGSTT